VLAVFHAGKQDVDQPGLVWQQAWPGGRKSDRQIAWGEISIFIVIALSHNNEIDFCFPLILQVNKTLTSLNVGGNPYNGQAYVGKEGGIAIIKALEVNFAIF
jgi:hypothetical protein